MTRRAMTQKLYPLITAAIFAIIALAHLVRVALDWSVAIGGWSAPMWLSWLAAVAAGALAFYGFKLVRQPE